MTDVEFATVLHRKKLRIKERHHAHDSAHMEMLDAKAALYLAQRRLECMEYQRKSSFNELCRLEDSVRSMHEKRNFTSAEASDPGLTEVTDEEIEARK